MKYLLTFIAVAIMQSCYLADKIEASHYHFYDHTKALIVVKRTKHKVYCKSPSGQRFYMVRDIYNRIQSDTIVLRDNKWVYAQTRFINKIPN